MLDSTQRRDFDVNGFVLVDGILPKDGLHAFGTSLARIIRYHLKRMSEATGNVVPISPGREFDVGMTALEEIDHAYVARISDTLSGMPEVMRLLSEPALLNFVRGIAGYDSEAPLFCTNAAAILAMPCDTVYTHGWHKDTFYTLPESNYLQLWAPLVQDATIELGTLKVCPGSHKAGWKGQERRSDVRNIHKFRARDDEIAKYDQVDVEMKPGEVLIFHSGLAHSAGKNVSNTCRFSLVGVYHQIEGPRFSARPELTADQYYEKLYGA